MEQIIMSIEKVKTYLKQFGLDDRIYETDEPTATVEQAAKAVGVIPARIAKTLSFQSDTGCILIVTAGDCKIDNKKFKQTFGIKARMLSPEAVYAHTGFTVGGVCPFIQNRPETVCIYLDQSLKRFETVFPAAGNAQSAVELSNEELYRVSNAQGWVDVCKRPLD